MASESKVEWPPQATMPEEIWLTFGDPHWWPTEEEGDIKYVRADAEQLMELRKLAQDADGLIVKLYDQDAIPTLMQYEVDGLRGRLHKAIRGKD